MPRQSAMLIASPSIPPAPSGDGDDAVPQEELAARVASGPGLWLDWTRELDRQGLLEELLAGGVIARALEEAPSRHCYDRALNAKMTVICVLAACLFPGEGYDGVLAAASGLPALRVKPGTGVPSGSAFSQARALPGEQAMKRAFELDAARSDADLGIDALRKGTEVTGLDGTTNGAGQERRAGRRVRDARRRRQAPAAGRRDRPHCHPPLDSRGDRRLPRRREHPGR